MTKEDAIEELSILLNKYQDGSFGDALDIAIEDIDKCGKIEKIIDSNDADFIANYIRGLFADDSGSYDSLTICEDAISRREAIKMFTYNYKGERIPDYDCDNFPVQTSIKKVKEMLRKLPPVNPQPKTGHWIVLSPTDMYCSECNEIEHLDISRRFCAYCGTRMSENPTGLESEGEEW